MSDRHVEEITLSNGTELSFTPITVHDITSAHAFYRNQRLKRAVEILGNNASPEAVQAAIAGALASEGKLCFMCPEICQWMSTQEGLVYLGQRSLHRLNKRMDRDTLAEMFGQSHSDMQLLVSTILKLFPEAYRPSDVEEAVGDYMGAKSATEVQNEPTPASQNYDTPTEVAGDDDPTKADG